MTRLDCNTARPLLDLYAAGACDAGERRAVRSHLDVCPDCRGVLTESRQLLGLLDLHYRQPVGLDRLRQRLEQEQGGRPLLLPFVRRYASLAAMVLVAFGLTLLLPLMGGDGAPAPSLQAVMVPGEDRLAMQQVRPLVDQVPAAPARGKAELEAVSLQMGRKRSVQWKELVQKAPPGRPPAPPTLALDFQLENTGARPILVEMGGPRGRCLLTVTGPEVVQRSAPGGLPPVEQATLRLQPAEAKRVPLLRLASQVGNAVVYLYPVAPGEYTLRAELRVRVREDGQRQSRTRTLHLGPVTLPVK